MDHAKRVVFFYAMLRFLDIGGNIFLLMVFDLWYNDYNILEFMEGYL